MHAGGGVEDGHHAARAGALTLLLLAEEWEPREARPSGLERGEELEFLEMVVGRWLGDAPSGPLDHHHPRGRRAVTALVHGWSATAIHALAERPLSLVEMRELVGRGSHRELKRHVEEMVAAELLAIGPDGRGGPSYAPTDWLREGIAALAAAAWLEGRHPDEGISPPDRLDVEAGFLLALPLTELPASLAGRCRLGVRLEGPGNPPPEPAGVTVKVDEGRIVACRRGLDDAVFTGIGGSPAEWLDTLIDPLADRLELGGDASLALGLIQSLHAVLFAPSPR